MNLKHFVFNPFGVNCFVLFNSKNETILIDPSVSNDLEQTKLANFIFQNKLIVKRLLNTHLHLDHVLGNAFVCRTYGVKPEAHKSDEFLLSLQNEQSKMFGLQVKEPSPNLGNYLADSSVINVSEINLKVIHVAGHSPGGLAFYCENPLKVNGESAPPLLFAGDILFAGSMGRSDILGGNEQDLISGIKNKLLTLPGDTIVFPGHGPSTTIAAERNNF